MSRWRKHHNRAKQTRRMERKMHAFLKRIAISTGVPTYHLERKWRPPTYSAARQYFRAMCGAVIS